MRPIEIMETSGGNPWIEFGKFLLGIAAGIAAGEIDWSVFRVNPGSPSPPYDYHVCDNV
jgi:hypothetical protein